MAISVFDLFKIGIGPSSSHTVGPMVAARRFLEETERTVPLDRVTRVSITLHGSLALTGRGHASDVAVLLGLAGERPAEVDPDRVPEIVAAIRSTGRLALLGRREIAFREAEDLVFDGTPLPGHSNGMRFTALGSTGFVLREAVYYSVGGGFVVSADELARGQAAAVETPVPHPFRNGREMLAMGAKAGLTIAQMVRANEVALGTPAAEIDARLDRIRSTMRGCIERGLAGEGVLPGGLKVRRRAKGLLDALREREGRNDRMAHEIVDWVGLYAIAVNEENAAGGRVVTAPTNGAAGILPAVLRYYEEFVPASDDEGCRTFLLTAAAIGMLFKRNASISGAEVGCQGEVGVACSMAAAGLAAALGGTNDQIENAAEIGIEHHLGMTCDPIGGLVQIPCIERNAMGAVKAITAASLALKGDGMHHVSLDAAIRTMRQTGLDMQSKYKETSQGGLAVNVTEC
jgi:L-serine dehydratase